MHTGITSPKWPTVAATVAGGLSALLGLTVLVGWYTHNTALLQIHPSFVAMVYNTALAFLLCGTALVAIALGRPRLALIGGVYAVTIGLLTLAEFTFAKNLGIDQLFMRHYVLVANAHPGRMALNTSVFLPLVGLGILWMSFPRRFRLRPLIVGLIGSLTFAQGLVAFTGYLTGITTSYAWGNLTRMAVHTAFGLAMLGAGLVALAWRDHLAERRKEVPRWLPIVVGVAVAGTTVCLWQALVIDQRAQTQRTVEAKTALLGNDIAVHIQLYTLALDRMARRWHLNGMKDEQHRKSDATMIVADYKGFDGIRWVDPSNHVAWTIPLQGHETEKGMYLAFEERRRAALEAARKTGRFAVSRPVEVTTGGKGLLIIVPFYDGDNFEGYIDGFFRIQHLLDSILSEETISGYAVVVSEGNDEIYHRSESSNQQGSEWADTKQLEIPGMDWRVEVWPEKKMLTKLQSSVPTITLVVGVLISLILAWTVWLAQAARNRSTTVEVTSLSLKREVAERTSAKNALSAALEKERLLLNSAVDVICSVDADGRFVSINPACQQLWGYSQEELIGRQYIDLVVPEDVAKTNEAAAKIMAGERATDFENRYRHKNGSQVHVMWSASWSENQQLIFSVARDITQRHLIEERLKKFAAELQRSNAELQDFASIASHDLQEPLRKIQSFAGELKVSLASKIHFKEQDTLDRMIAAAIRMRTLINDLLTFSRVTTMAKPFVPVDLALTVKEVLSDLEERTRDTKARIEVCDLPTIDADPIQMRQLLQNLIGNGLKFHAPGIAPIIKISGENGGPNYRLSVTDNGIGFDEKYLDRIFTMFQRLHGRKEYEGTGIGLAICRKIVERHGGQIIARSAPSVGSTFTITLPLKQSNEEKL
jgi:PAS domain S-box-containing protein